MARYADKPTIDVSVDIAAPVAAVWDLVTDINMPARFSAEFQGAEWLDDAVPGLGARFVGHNERKTAKWDTTCTVIDFVPLERFGYAVNDIDDPAASWWFDLEPVGAGCRLTMTAEMGPGPSGVISYIRKHPEREEEIVALRLEEWHGNMIATVNGIKAVAEKSPA